MSDYPLFIRLVLCIRVLCPPVYTRLFPLMRKGLTPTYAPAIVIYPVYMWGLEVGLPVYMWDRRRAFPPVYGRRVSISAWSTALLAAL